MERGAAIANDAARRISQLLAGRGVKILSRIAPAVEIGLAAAIGLVLLLIVMALFAPLPTPQRLPGARPEAAAAAPATGEISNPFRPAGSSEAAAPIEEKPDLAETKLDLTLHGTWVDENGGAAIIKTPDGRQDRFSVGDEIWSGVRLDRVYRDQVVIISGGARELLSLVNRDSAAPPSQRTVRQAPPNTAAAPAIALSDAVQIVPRAGPNGLRLTLEPGANTQRFAALGLRMGDILIAVDNRRIGPEIAFETQKLRELASRSSISVIVERDGVALPVEIDLAAEGETEPNDG